MPETLTCPRCGQPLLADSPGGLCPRCLLAAVALADEPSTGVDEVAARTARLAGRPRPPARWKVSPNRNRPTGCRPEPAGSNDETVTCADSGSRGQGPEALALLPDLPEYEIRGKSRGGRWASFTRPATTGWAGRSRSR